MQIMSMLMACLSLRKKRSLKSKGIPQQSASFQIRPCELCGKPKALGAPCVHCRDVRPEHNHGAINYDAIKAEYGSPERMASTMAFQRAKIESRSAGGFGVKIVHS
jgi:hypothetical protein